MVHRLSLLVLVLIFSALSAAGGATVPQPVPDASQTPVEQPHSEDPQAGAAAATTDEQPALTPAGETPRLDDLDSSSPKTFGPSCVDPSCLYDFECYQICAEGPPGEFCSCVQSCIVLC